MRRLCAEDTLLLASANQGKIAELSSLLAPYEITLDSITEYHNGEMAEDGATFEDNALQKARFASAVSGLPALADDSGFCVVALDDAPGIYSARWAGPRKDFLHAMGKVRAEMPDNAFPEAYFVCVLALCFPDGSEACFRGEIHGEFCWPPRGTKGFGYDPVFIPEGNVRTFGEMLPEEKDHTSHRARAFTQFQQRALPTLRS